MLKIVRCQSKCLSVYQTFEVTAQNTHKFNYFKRNHHFWNGRQQYYLCTNWSVLKKENGRCAQYSAPLINKQFAAGFANSTLPDIPEPPPTISVPDIVEHVTSLSANGEPTLASMGLGGWSPVGIVQNSLEYLHVTYDIPWWGAIIIGTICVRLLVFPIVIIAQRNNARMNNNLPQIQAIQLKMTQARQTGNQLDSARYAQELMLFMKEKGLSPVRSMLVPLVQAPFFISFFVGLRRMANCPVESMSTGGLFWFTDLCVPDQFYLLPIITSLTLLVTIEIGAETGRMNANNMVLMKYGLRALPVIMFPFIINFPGAILCYWTSSNFISLIQVSILKIPRVREYFKIEKIIRHTPDTLPIKSKGFVKGVKESWTNMKITREIEDRMRVDEMLFNKAGKGPLQKTYKYDPTKHPGAISAKNKDI